MKYASTQGGITGVDFESVLLSGFAPDGGLFMPEEVPKLDIQTLHQWSRFSYIELVKEVCAIYIPSEVIPRKELNGLIDNAFRRFRHKDIVPLSRLSNGLNVLEMWHGVTHAFKDLAMSCVGQFLQYFLRKRNKHVTILVGTSGDTGSSAIESVRGVKDIDIIVLLPSGRCTRVQELQMTTVIEENVHLFTADGTSDDLDVPIKKLFADHDFVVKHNLMSLNSVNWSRILVQISHFFYAYFKCAPSIGPGPLPVVEIVVPTGGAGNIAAGCIAQKMGLPLRIVVGVNNNDIVHRIVQHGDFSITGSVQPTVASAMDIQEPYNMERIFWLLMDSDYTFVKNFMEDFQKTKNIQLPETLHKKIKESMTSFSASDEDILQTMARCWKENHYLLCPHSAVSAFYHYKQLDSRQNSPRCCLAPASAAKFQDVVRRAQLTPEIPPEIRELENMETRSIPLERHEDWEQILRDKIEAIYQKRQL